jgi:uncharacterized protein
MEYPPLSLRHIDLTFVGSVKMLSGVVLATLLVLLLIAAPLAAAPAFEKQPLSFVTSSGSHQITVEIADTPQKRSLGLMFRRTLGKDEGMIFLHEKSGPVGMWMKNTYIPLDMFFVRADGVIHRIEKHTEPFSETTVSSEGDVFAVIEMIAGSADRLGIKPGDRVDYPAFE